MYWCLLGVLVVIIGFAIKLEPIAIIVVSAIVTAIFGGINVIDLLETVGTTFVANRNQLITIILMILTGTLERNGLKEAGADLIRRAKGLTTGMLIAIWGVLDEIFIIFKIPIGGIPSFVRPIMMPMTPLVSSRARAMILLLSTKKPSRLCTAKTTTFPTSVPVRSKLFRSADSVHPGKYRLRCRRYADCYGTGSCRYLRYDCQCNPDPHR